MGDQNMSKVSLKLLIDTKAKKVLFAEAGKGFVDFLFHILSLPLATVVKLLTMESGMVGSLGDLCESIEALKSEYIQPDVTKHSVLNPEVNTTVNVPFLLLNNNDDDDAPSRAKKFYRCSNSSSNNCRMNVTDSIGADYCPNCRCHMSSQMHYVVPMDPTDSGPSSSTFSGGRYVKGVVTCMVMDNLQVKPMSSISGITLINKFNVKDLASLEEEVQIGLTEGVALLNASLQTKNVLTKVFLLK